MSLIKFRQTAIQGNVCRILWSVVGVEIRGGIEAFAVGVIPEQGEVLTEALFDFHDTAFVNSGCRRGVLVVLYHQRTHKALSGVTGQALNAAQRVSSRGRRIPVAIGNRLAIGQSYCAEWRGQQIGIDRDWEPLRVRIDNAERN